MDAAAWDERYAATELVWSARPNKLVKQWLADRGWQVTAIDWSSVAVEKGRKVDGTVDWQVGNALTAPLPADLDLVVIAYFQVAAAERRTAVRRAFEALRTGGNLFLVAHDSTNLTEGTGGPQDPAVLYTAEDVLGDLDGARLEVVRSE